MHDVPYLFLAKFDCQFQAVQVHALSVLEYWTGRIVVQHHFQFVWRSCVIQQCGRKILTLSPQLLIFILREIQIFTYYFLCFQLKNIVVLILFFLSSYIDNDALPSFALTLNSCSRKLSRRNSQDSSNAVNIGSFDESEIRLGLANARYAFIRERECLSESSKRAMTHSSQPHLHQGTDAIQRRKCTREEMFRVIFVAIKNESFKVCHAEKRLLWTN